MKRLFSILLVLLAVTGLGFTQAAMTATASAQPGVGIPAHAQARFHNIVTATVSLPDGRVLTKKVIHNQIQDAGWDYIALQVSGATVGTSATVTTAGTAGCNYIGISNTDNSTALTSVTTLSGEAGVGSGNYNVGRGQGTRETSTHAAGTKIYHVYKSWTASGGTVNVRSTGLFTAASSGTMCFVADFGPTVIPDTATLTVDWAVTMGT